MKRESISYSTRLHDAYYIFPGKRQNLLAKYCRRNQGWNGLPAIIEILKIGRCTRGGKGSEKDDSLGNSARSLGGLRQEGWLI